MSMTREQILIEQSGYDCAYADTNLVYYPRGERVWTPLGKSANRWQCQEFKDGFLPGTGTVPTTTPFRQLITHFVATVVTGQYHISMGRKVADNTGCTTTDVAPTYAGGMTKSQNAYYCVTIGGTLSVILPANTTRVYVLAAQGGSADQGSLSITSTGGTVLRPTLNSKETGGDFSGGTTNVDINGNTLPAQMRWVKVATGAGLGGATITLTALGNPSVPTNPYVLPYGFLSIQDASTATSPDVGVYDPDTVQIVSQLAPSVTSAMTMTIGAGTQFIWAASGEHLASTLNPDAKFIGGVQNLSYASGTTWAGTANKWQNQITTEYAMRMDGTIGIGTATGLDNIGNYSRDWVFTPSGSFTRDRWAFNAAAQSNTVNLIATGAYPGMWGLRSSTLGKGRMLPVDTANVDWTVAGEATKVSTSVLAIGNQLSLHYVCMATLRTATTLKSNMTSWVSYSGGNQTKIYTYLLPADYAIVDGDVIESCMMRALSDRSNSGGSLLTLGVG
jgi:hypothetical protein